jgi:hypothetical protein
MVNVGFSLASILGLLQILCSVVYLALSISHIITAVRSRQYTKLVFPILQLIFGPFIFVLSGVILFFQGWRLDPILLFQQFLMNILLAYYIYQDFNKSRRTS